jgi:1-aminocyclopropane-1-carboxylate deaminase/D-cysteine desulfhydrase-like pyridoxal-dependent ACC family enzyme
LKPPLLIEPWTHPEFTAQHCAVDVLRLDRLHPIVSGNKWFKLQKHLQLAAGAPILTFGGPWSNHLVAAAYAAREAGLDATGIIRGERPHSLSATLQDAVAYGMQLEFISRERYTQKTMPAFLQELITRYPGAYIIPEGGGGLPGVDGSEDILRIAPTAAYSHILCAIGTGTTWMGLIRAALPGQTVVGVPVLKGITAPFGADPHRHLPPLSQTDPHGHRSLLSQIDPDGWLSPTQTERARVLPDYHFGGFARHPPELLDFMNRLYRISGIPTDIVYTGKLFYAVENAVTRKYFPPRSRLLVIHSGGLQGNRSLPQGQLVF